jgi:hypothetical protein
MLGAYAILLEQRSCFIRYTGSIWTSSLTTLWLQLHIIYIFSAWRIPRLELLRTNYTSVPFCWVWIPAAAVNPWKHAARLNHIWHHSNLQSNQCMHLCLALLQPLLLTANAGFFYWSTSSQSLQSLDDSIIISMITHHHYDVFTSSSSWCSHFYHSPVYWWLPLYYNYSVLWCCMWNNFDFSRKRIVVKHVSFARTRRFPYFSS